MPLDTERLSHLTKTLGGMVYQDAIPVSWHICDQLQSAQPMPPADDPRWRPLLPDDLWGSRLTWAWLKATVPLPDSFAGKPAALRIAFRTLSDRHGAQILTAPEAMLRVSGLDVPPQAFNHMHSDALITESTPAGTSLGLALDCFCGVSQPGDHRVNLALSELAWIDRDIEGLFWDAHVILAAAEVMPEPTPQRGRLLRAVHDAFQLLDWLDPTSDEFRASVRAARAALQQRLADADLAPEAWPPTPTIHALGHAHIDVAWLWTLAVTRGKAARTFATALALMQQYPQYTFTQSQPHLYKMVAEDHPDLFAQIKARVAEGRWNATGGTWVEPDTNMPGGESLVRQFLFGMRFFQRELGARPEVLWLPDVFGYNAALPQLIRLAGLHYFYTSKMSWSTYNRFPYDTFWWEGIDGTRVLAHLATTPEPSPPPQGRQWTTYNSHLTPAEMWHTWARYNQKDANHHLLVAFGMGDGGGGPNRDMLERRARMAHLPGMPRVIHSTAECFFHALEQTIPEDLPRWVGELYLQVHRGTLTSQARTKRHNRKTEVLLHDAEALCSTAYLLEGDYPQNTLNAAWETVLLHQFHDILPGSSITPVYQDTEREYATAQARASDALAQAMQTIAGHLRWDPDMQGFVIFNTLSTTQGGPVEVTLPGEGPVEIVGPSGRHKPYQWIDRQARRALVIPNSVPAYGHKAYSVRQVDQPAPVPVYGPVEGTLQRLENEFLRADFDSSGTLLRLYDREHAREVLAPGSTGNQLWAYVDRPPHWDAWDVEASVQQQGWLLRPESVRLLESGPLRATLEMVYAFNRSRIVQRISLISGSRLLCFDTEVDWHEQHILLRAHFPVAIRAMQATYEIQFGTVQRPTHQNTDWDRAQHEVAAQRWIDLSEADYGVSLLNDCKYGHSVRDNVLTISLLRAPTDPDPVADQGRHTFLYALYPHTGDWRNGTVAQARRMNHPLRALPLTGGGGTWLPVVWGLVFCETPGVVIDTVKKAEDDDALIVRVYEAHGGHQTASLVFSAPLLSAEEVNLLEEPLGPVEMAGDCLRFDLTPYQVRSFHVQLSDVVSLQLGQD